MSWLDDVVGPVSKDRRKRPTEDDMLRQKMALITAELELLRAKLAPPPPPPFPIRALRHRHQVIGLVSWPGARR